MEKVIVIVGPTGIGKTKLSVELAKYLNGEIISGDSMQVYKGLNIGTAKIKEAEKQGITHYLIDTKEIKENYSIYTYQREVREAIKTIIKKKKVPILVGGSGLYLKAALYDYEFNEETDADSSYDNLDNNEAYNLLKQLDEVEASKLHPNNRVRVIRALKIIKNNQMSKTQYLANQEHKLLYDALFIGLSAPREIVYKRIDQRVDKMVEEGLVSEVRELFNKYGKENYACFKAIGYKELFAYFKGEMSLDSSIELIKKRSRNYAKRQYTWFNNQFIVNWFEVNFADFNKTVKEAMEFIEEYNYGK